MGDAPGGYLLAMAAFAAILVGAAILRLRDAAKLKACPHCREEVDRRATICPHCRAPLGG